MVFNFNDLDFGPHYLGGVHAHHTAANGYTASVIKFPGSHGFSKNLYEMAIKKGEEIVYDTALTDNVLGNLTKEDVQNFIMQMELLDPKTGRLPKGVQLYVQQDK